MPQFIDGSAKNQQSLVVESTVARILQHIAGILLWSTGNVRIECWHVAGIIPALKVREKKFQKKFLSCDPIIRPPIR